MGYPKLLFDNRFSDAAPVASDTAAGNYAAANVNDARSYTWWKGLAMPCYLRVHNAALKPVDYALILGHDMFTQGATLEVRGSTDNFVTSNVLIATVTPTSNDPFLVEFAAATYLDLEFNFTGPTNPSIAMALLGSAFVMPKFISSGFDPIGRSVIGQANANEEGNPLGKIINFEARQQSLQFANVTYAWLRATWLPAWNSYLRASPFILAWDSVNYPAELAYLTMDDGSGNAGFSSPHKPGGLVDLSFNVYGAAS